MIELDNLFIKKAFKRREAESHKGDYGKVLVIAGSSGMAGACVLSANAAVSAGAGLVHAAFPEGQESNILPRLRPEVMTFAVEEQSSGGYMSNAAEETLLFASEKNISACLIGPGMGSEKSTKNFILNFIERAPFPLVIDADALNALSSESSYSDILAARKGLSILTPHLGEFARMMGKEICEIKPQKEKLAREFAFLHNTIVVLKGSRSIVTDGMSVFVSPTGNPGMAKGGCGDILAGLTAAFIAQMNKPEILNAALAGVFVHGTAGDLGVREKGEIPFVPSDIVEFLPKAFKNIWYSQN